MKCSDCEEEFDLTSSDASEEYAQCPDCHEESYLDYVNTLEDMVMEGYYED